MNLKFKFTHTPEEDRSRLAPAGTICQLLDKNNIPCAIGYARLHPGDNFNRPLGRKISAARAIRAYVPRYGKRDTFGAAVRRKLWKQLASQSPKTVPHFDV